ncbi:hypothetical protein BG004_004232 [Podila humilis]|nr:hypothetical protein BG004_004232 [Podila humilis]
MTANDDVVVEYTLGAIQHQGEKESWTKLLEESEEQALMADGVALSGDRQVYLVKAALLYNPKMGKQLIDKFKLERSISLHVPIQIIERRLGQAPPEGASPIEEAVKDRWSVEMDVLVNGQTALLRNIEPANQVHVPVASAQLEFVKDLGSQRERLMEFSDPVYISRINGSPGLSVFGTSSYGDETKFYVMDFVDA